MQSRGKKLAPKPYSAFTIRIATPLHTKLVKEAKKQQRSLTAQVEFDLQRLYK